MLVYILRVCALSLFYKETVRIYTVTYKSAVLNPTAGKKTALSQHSAVRSYFTVCPSYCESSSGRGVSQIQASTSLIFPIL